MRIPQAVLPYVKYAPTIALVFGFVFDIATLNRPDAIFENVVIVGYLALGAVVIATLHARGSYVSDRAQLFLLSILQFAFGNLASALLVLYARSGTFAGNAIFIGILALLLVGNELLKDRYARAHLRIVIWSFLLLTYTTLVVPVILNSLGTLVFVVSVGCATSITFLFVWLLSRLTQTPTLRISLSVAFVAIAFGSLYAANLIPPVPLALKHVGIYHDVVRSGDTYTLQYEQKQWYEFWRDTNVVFNHTPGTPTYCFASVFAPSDLQTEVRHRWEKYDETREAWVTIARIPFAISGGRLGGFRGYTQTSQVDDGTWRCSVETARGALIGRVTFRVEAGEPVLQTREL